LERPGFQFAGLGWLFWILILILSSCSGHDIPTIPTSECPDSSTVSLINERNARSPIDTRDHFAWGVYTMVIDQLARTVEVIDNRELAAHLNVRAILESKWWCPAKNCIRIQFLNIDEENHLYTIKGTLANPTWFNGFDVRVIIFYDEKGHELRNPDDFTRLYETGDYINPFRAYAKEIPQRQFGSYLSFSENFELYIPPVPKKFCIDFAVDASWPSNCPEPYDIRNFGFDGMIYPDDPETAGVDQGEGVVFAEVRDWQLNICEVSIDTTPITGGITALQYNPALNRWEATITNSEDAPAGEYLCLIAAYSSDDPSLGLYNYLTIEVDESAPKAVQTISGHVGDSFDMAALDGSIVTALNQDPDGYVPDPVSVFNGEYLVHVTTGAYNISVVPDDTIHLPHVCRDVIVTDDEHISIDFGLNDPSAIDPHDPFKYLNWPTITGFAGRVMDEAGSPIANATIELTSPDSWGDSTVLQEFVQAETSDEDGYFSMLNVPVRDRSGNVIHEFAISVRAPGFRQAELDSISAVTNSMQYERIVLETEVAEDPIWSESFEQDTGWELHGYYHRQVFDPAVRNISYDPQYTFLVVPADELISWSLPRPTDGDHYLWYGVVGDGNYLGEWDPLQGAYTGGLSEKEHTGWAISPEIDLAGYSAARLEFDLAYEIESHKPGNYDLMRLYVLQGTDLFPVTVFNPFAELGTHEYVFSQRGYNRSVMWCDYSLDLSAYVGGKIRLRFDFATKDSRYNGGRGQFVDNIRLYAH